MNHGHCFDRENAEDRKLRIKEQQRRQKLEYRINSIKLHLWSHPRKIPMIERLLGIKQ